jgi:hypothetical protein
MTVLLARYDVTDLARFLAAFDALEPARRARGSTGHWLLRPSEERGEVIALIRFGSREEAEGFAASPEREAALRDARVTARQDEILEVVRSAPAT